MDDQFEWDESKAAENERKHGVKFDEAVTVFADPHVLLAYDEEHSEDEDRFQALGVSVRLRHLLVVHCERGPVTRIISARMANAFERSHYESQLPHDSPEP